MGSRRARHPTGAKSDRDCATASPCNHIRQSAHSDCDCRGSWGVKHQQASLDSIHCAGFRLLRFLGEDREALDSTGSRQEFGGCGLNKVDGPRWTCPVPEERQDVYHHQSSPKSERVPTAQVKVGEKSSRKSGSINTSVVRGMLQFGESAAAAFTAGYFDLQAGAGVFNEARSASEGTCH